MIVTMDLDLTEETAESINKFRTLFTTYGFLTLALQTPGIGQTDLASLYRILTGVLTQASGSQLCTVPAPVTIASAQEAIEQCSEMVTLIKDELLTWFLLQPVETQKAILELLSTIQQILKTRYQDLPPEQQAFWQQLITVLKLLKGELV